MASQAARNGPGGAGVEGTEKLRVRHQTGDAAVAAQKGMHPQQPMVRGGYRNDRFRLAGAAVDLCKPLHESGQGSWRDRHMPSDLDIPGASFAGHHAQPFLGERVLHPKEMVGQQLTEAAMDFADASECDGAPVGQRAAIDPLLNGDVGFGFQLQVALAGVLAVVVLERAFDVDGVGVVALNEVGVVAVHRPDRAGKRGEQTGGQASSEAGGFLREVEGEIQNRATVAVAIPEEEGLHEGDVFAPVVRSQVRFHDRFGS
jgi:hypothetical protein